MAMTCSTELLAACPGVADWPPLPQHGIPMQTQAWMQARVALVPDPAGLRFFAVRQGMAVEALAPLVEVGGWLRELPAMFEPSDLVWSTPRSLDRLARALAAQPLPVQFDRVPATSPTITALRRAYAGRALVLLREAMPTPLIDLAPGQDVAAGLSGERRAEFRRAERRAGAFGRVGYELHRPTTDAELTPLLDEAYAVEARSWKAAAGSALTADPAQGGFFRQFAAMAAWAGMLRIAFLRIDSRPAAMQIALEWQQRFWLLKISHDEAYGRCSPGQLLMLHTLRQAAAAGLQAYEFMGIMDDWTARWTRQQRRYLQVRALPFSAAVGRMLARRSARAIVGRLRRFVG